MKSKSTKKQNSPTAIKEMKQILEKIPDDEITKAIRESRDQR